MKSCAGSGSLCAPTIPQEITDLTTFGGVLLALNAGLLRRVALRNDAVSPISKTNRGLRQGELTEAALEHFIAPRFAMRCGSSLT